MSHDPYPNERPNPYKADPYATDPFVPGRSAGTNPTPNFAAPPPLPLQPGAPAPPPTGPGMPPPYAYLQPSPPNTSAIVLTVISGMTVMTGYCCVIGIAPLILGILGITKNTSDPEGAAQLTKVGWIVYAALVALFLLIAAIIIVAVIASES